MAVTSADLKYYLSSASATSANNTGGGLVTSIGGAISATEIVSGSNNNLFDAVSSAEAISGRVEYRLVYVTNENVTPQTLYASRVFVLANTVAAETKIEIALDPAAVGSNSSITLVDEIDSTNLLSGLTFSLASSFNNGLVIGDMPGGSKKAVWIKRTITAGAAAAQETATLSLQGETDV